MAIARVGEVELEYEVVGEGEPLVLIMGFAAQLILWPDVLVERLVKDGFKVVRFDNRDVGQSTKLDHLGTPNVRAVLARTVLGLPVQAPYCLDDMADDVVGLLDHLGLPSAHVVGASMGGMIAQAMAIRHPRRVRTLTSVMSTPGGRRYAVGDPRALGALLQPPAKSREQSAERFVQMFRTIGGRGFHTDERDLRSIGERSWDRGVFPRGAARQFTAILAEGKRRHAGLERLSTPTLVVHGTDDPLIPIRAGRATAKLIPGARFLPIEGMGHDFPKAAMPLLAGAVRSLVENAAR